MDRAPLIREIARFSPEAIKMERKQTANSNDLIKRIRGISALPQSLSIALAGLVLSTGLNILIPEAGYAACSNGNGNALISSKKDGDLIYFIGKVSTYECGNQDGSFAGYEFRGESTGWKICYRNCNMPSLQGKAIVRINGVDLEGGMIKKTAGGYCISEKAKDAEYCWSESNVE